MYAWNEEELPWRERISNEKPTRTVVADAQRLKASAVADHMKCDVKIKYDPNDAIVVAHSPAE